MAISLLREASKLSLQNLLRSNEIWVGSSILTAQRRNLFQQASQLGKTKKKFIDHFKILPTYLRPNNLYRHFSSSLSSSTSGFRKWYLVKLETNPVITKSVSASLIYTSADITSQVITMPSDGSFDLFRLLRMCSYALLIAGPCQHYWFGYLSKIMPKKNLLTTLSKMVMGQAIYAPCVGSIFFSYNAALRGENGHEIVARLKRDLLPALKNSIMYWPFCDFMTFMFVPVHLQPLVTSSLAYLWIVYLSYVASLKKVGSVEAKEQALVKTESNHAILPSKTNI